ncbi:hypothetical protein [Ketobacter sp.]|uniref:hypothetical protein n=1 Tax=Ketobacter sp. TaxID=2083498 RepID=UPI000F2A432A|nr:hypothetical protein [Ketobacter sp.]RLU01068.1 MAG: hypothetical protein D9N14_03705 [Ketobacter sp.]
MSIAAAAPAPVSRALSVSSVGLLSLYLVMPALLLWVGMDALFWQHQWRDQWLPQYPAELLIWAIVFNFPHIVSSLVTLVDQEYWQFYRCKLVLGLAVIVTLVLAVNVMVPLVASRHVADQVYLAFFLFYSTYTVWHVLSQQFGIGLMLMRVTPRALAFYRWRGLSTLAGALMYVKVFGGMYLQGEYLFGMELERLVLDAALISVVLATLAGIPLWRQSRRALGTWYGLGNLAILPVSYVMLVLDYNVFVVMIPRFIHDLTAFQVYAVHDHNRNRECHRNLVYRWLRFIPLTPLLLCPLLAILLANSIECGSMLVDTLLGTSNQLPQKCFMDPAAPLSFSRDLPGTLSLWLQVLFICGFFHYFIEGFVWKRESIHRHSVGFN